MAAWHSAAEQSDPPAISVIVPTHDRASLLPRALASLLAQDFAPFEVIVVDDGSRDGTAAFLSGVSDPRLRVLRHGRALGAAGARNSALALARAPIVAFLDDDDEALPGFLAETARAHASPPAIDLCWTGVIFRQSDGSEKSLDWSRWAGSRRF